MSFCSQALIGFCKAETGLSKDVGVALSMGQGEPVPIQPWTLPPTHPLSLGSLNVDRFGSPLELTAPLQALPSPCVAQTQRTACTKPMFSVVQIIESRKC